MKHTYKLKFYPQNPRNQRHETYDTLMEAVSAARRAIGQPDEGQPATVIHLIRGDEIVASAKTTDKRLTWL